MRRKAFWKFCRDLAKIEDETTWGFAWGLMGELWMNRAVFEALGSWRSAEDTANGRLRKKAMLRDANDQEGEV